MIMEEDIQSRWRDSRIVVRNSMTAEELTDRRIRTALQNLARRYKRFSIMALVMVAWCPLFGFSHPYIDHKPYLALGFAVFFVTCAAMDRWLYTGISSIDPATMTTSEVVRRSILYRKRHFEFQMILIPMAGALIGTLIYLFQENQEFIWGIVFGMLIGAGIGFFHFLRFMKDYRIVRESLR